MENEVEKLKNLFSVELLQGDDEIAKQLRDNRYANWVVSTTFKIALSADIHHDIMEIKMGWDKDDVMAQGYVRMVEDNAKINHFINKHKMAPENIQQAIEARLDDELKKMMRVNHG